jgi:hypothetical protein
MKSGGYEERLRAFLTVWDEIMEGELAKPGV